jgi:hypothetical protein
MRVVSVYDLSGSESMRALRHLRRQNLRAMTGKEDVEVESDEILRQVYERTGGRTSYLAKVSRADDMLGAFFPDYSADIRWLTGRGSREYDRDGKGVAIVKVGDGLPVSIGADEKDWPDS